MRKTIGTELKTIGIELKTIGITFLSVKVSLLSLEDLLWDGGTWFVLFTSR